MLAKTTIRQRGDIGDYFPFFGTTLPTGYMYCDGRSLSTTGTYADLFAKLAYRFGGSGGNFNIPDTRGRAVAHAGTADDPTSNNIGALAVSPGTQTITLGGGLPVPAHTHPQSIYHLHGDGAGNFVNYHSHDLGDNILSTTQNIRQGADILVAALYGSGSDGNVGDASYSTGGTVADAYTNVSISTVSGHSQANGFAEAHPNMMSWVAIPFIIRFAY